jgi:putative transposase
MTYHLNAKGTAGESIFLQDWDRHHFLQLLELVVERHRWICLAYCLMGTHYHLVVETPELDLDRGMHRLNACHAQSFNRRHGRFGHLFAERFHSIQIVHDEHLLAAIRYVSRNPVEAGLCRYPWQWEWSSYRATVGMSRPPAFLAVDNVLRLFGRDRRRARRNLRRFVEEE